MSIPPPHRCDKGPPEQGQLPEHFVRLYMRSTCLILAPACQHRAAQVCMIENP